MSKLKACLFAATLLPLVSFAHPVYNTAQEEALLAPDRYYSDVPLVCYAGFRAVIEMLPELTNQLNIMMGQNIIVIDNVNTPNGYNTVFEWDTTMLRTTVHHQLEQDYTPGADPSSGTLYLNFILNPPTQIDNIWKIVDGFMNSCATNLPENPTIPCIPGLPIPGCS